MNMIATNNTFEDILKAIALFDGATKNLKADAILFITGKKQNLKTARAFIGLSKNMKMPDWTLAIPARSTCPRGGKLAKVEPRTLTSGIIVETVCNGCYAVKGHDGMQPAITAKARRVSVIELALVSETIRALWVKAFVMCLSKSKYFRWHSAGDLFSAAYVQLILDCITLTPQVTHWIPTKEPILCKPLQGLVNATVRLSDDFVDQLSNKFKGLTSGVHNLSDGRGQACPASEKLQDGCQECRACWSMDVPHVSYRKH